jgi:hypothetical protein
MKTTILLLCTASIASIALTAHAQSATPTSDLGGFNTELPRLHWKVSEAEKALATDLKNLGVDGYIADCPDEDQMAKIHQDEKLLDEAVKEWKAANQ